ncbi:mycofactocin biosynthesis glycosyltransferase MftF [Microbacterium karelineae]|uniref:mycofactocin biosynthesis glycosyltransferase MftF n=1 Tax=Microbacterium karelineae TaxID=2654283 RepID=UPI0018D42A04|nr:mycofactocin biosynthesis glycosyltransferase MftF [Microbacterium karelineae]
MTSHQERALPDGAVVRLARRTRVIDGGAALIGGAPPRVSRLAPAARRLIRDRAISVTGRAGRALAARLVEAGQADPDPATLPEGDPRDVTVVVPAFGRSRQLGRLLDSVRDDLGDTRIIVVDDGSAPADAARIARAACARDAELVVLPENRGPADARNAGLALVRTSFVLFVDTDVVLRRGSVRLLLRHFADPRLAVAAPRVVGLEGPRPSWVLRYETDRSSLDHGGDPSLVRPHSPTAWVSTTCVLARVAALADGFGTGMRVAEDVDLVWRLVERGWRVRYEPRAAVEHEHRASVRRWLARKFVYGTGAGALAHRHGPLAAPAVLAPWAVGVLLALGAQRSWSLPVAAAIAAVAAGRIAHRIRGVRHPGRVAARLTAEGTSAALSQGSALVVRHWWPAFAVAGLFSRRARRLIVVSAIADAAVEYARLRPRLDPLRFLVARRLDDLAYGAGVWWGALRDRSPRALAPYVSSRPARGR